MGKSARLPPLRARAGGSDAAPKAGEEKYSDECCLSEKRKECLCQAKEQRNNRKLSIAPRDSKTIRNNSRAIRGARTILGNRTIRDARTTLCKATTQDSRAIQSRGPRPRARRTGLGEVEASRASDLGLGTITSRAQA